MAEAEEQISIKSPQIRTCTLGDLAKDQAGRHPGAPRRGRPSRTGTTSNPLLISGKPALRFQRRDENGGGGERSIPVLSPTALMDGTFDVSSLQTTPFTADGAVRSRGLEDSLTQVDDVVISLYPPFGCACVEEGTAGVFVPTSCVIVRMDGESRKLLDPWYLVGYLSTRTLKEEVLPAKTNRRSLSLEDLASLEILLPPIETQQRLGELVRLHASAARSRWHLDGLETSMLEGAYAQTLAAEGGQ